MRLSNENRKLKKSCSTLLILQNLCYLQKYLDENMATVPCPGYSSMNEDNKVSGWADLVSSSKHFKQVELQSGTLLRIPYRTEEQITKFLCSVNYKN